MWSSCHCAAHGPSFYASRQLIPLCGLRFWRHQDLVWNCRHSEFFIGRRVEVRKSDVVNYQLEMPEGSEILVIGVLFDLQVVHLSKFSIFSNFKFLHPWFTLSKVSFHSHLQVPHYGFSERLKTRRSRLQIVPQPPLTSSDYRLQLLTKQIVTMFFKYATLLAFAASAIAGAIEPGVYRISNVASGTTARTYNAFRPVYISNTLEYAGPYELVSLGLLCLCLGIYF